MEDLEDQGVGEHHPSSSWEYSGENGFMSSREWALSTWRAEREQRAFERLCRTLQTRRYNQRYRAKHPELAERSRKRWERWRKRDPERAARLAEESYKRQLAQRKLRRLLRQKEHVCPVCAQTWRSNGAYGKKYCSKECYRRARQSREGRKGLRTSKRVLQIVAKCPGISTADLARYLRITRKNAMRSLALLLEKELVCFTRKAAPGRGANPRLYAVTPKGKRAADKLPRIRGPRVGEKSSYPPELVRRVEEHYANGKSMQEVAQVVGVSAKKVWSVMHRHGIKPRPPNSSIRRKRRLKTYPSDLVQQIAEHYSSGKTIRQVASILGIGAKKVLSVMRRHGIESRPVGTYRRVRKTHQPELVQQIEAHYRRGNSMRQVGALLGISASKVRRIMQEYGVEARPDCTGRSKYE